MVLLPEVYSLKELQPLFPLKLEEITAEFYGCLTVQLLPWEKFVRTNRKTAAFPSTASLPNSVLGMKVYYLCTLPIREEGGGGLGSVD